MFKRDNSTISISLFSRNWRFAIIAKFHMMDSGIGDLFTRKIKAKRYGKSGCKDIKNKTYHRSTVVKQEAVGQIFPEL